MSFDPNDHTRDDGFPGDVEPNCFRAGERVVIDQLGLVDEELASHCMGIGELLFPPRLGGLLELRIRGPRGLLSSRIHELRSPAPGYLLAATAQSIYLVALPEHQTAARPERVVEAAFELLKSGRPERSEGGDPTQYVRLELDSESVPGALPRGPVFASVERPGHEPEKEELGLCELLSDVVPGSPLRIAVADGRVLATSDVTSVMSTDGHEFWVRTGNSCYLLCPLVESGDAGSRAAGGRTSSEKM